MCVSIYIERGIVCARVRERERERRERETDRQTDRQRDRETADDYIKTMLESL